LAYTRESATLNFSFRYHERCTSKAMSRVSDMERETEAERRETHDTNVCVSEGLQKGLPMFIMNPTRMQNA
jgi:hypothetical protein